VRPGRGGAGGAHPGRVFALCAKDAKDPAGAALRGVLALSRSVVQPASFQRVARLVQRLAEEREREEAGRPLLCAAADLAAFPVERGEAFAGDRSGLAQRVVLFMQVLDACARPTSWSATAGSVGPAVLSPLGRFRQVLGLFVADEARGTKVAPLAGLPGVDSRASWSASTSRAPSASGPRRCWACWRGCSCGPDRERAFGRRAFPSALPRLLSRSDSPTEQFVRVPVNTRCALQMLAPPGPADLDFS
jgi:hypothetical protein